MIPFANYVLHLASAIMLILAFFIIYTYVTPIDEILLIRQGNNAAALSFGGALTGFSLTIASSIFHNNTYYLFLAWAAGGLLVQILVYVVATRLLRISKSHIESGNTAFGGLLGALSLSLGIINAACIS
jgi:putative membrane protein